MQLLATIMTYYHIFPWYNHDFILDNVIWKYIIGKNHASIIFFLYSHDFPWWLFKQPKVLYPVIRHHLSNIPPPLFSTRRLHKRSTRVQNPLSSRSFLVFRLFPILSEVWRFEWKLMIPLESWQFSRLFHVLIFHFCHCFVTEIMFFPSNCLGGRYSYLREPLVLS